MPFYSEAKNTSSVKDTSGFTMLKNVKYYKQDNVSLKKAISIQS